MKIIRNIIILVFAIIAILAIFPNWSSQSQLFGQDESRKVSRSIDVNPDVYFSLSNKFGDIEVIGWDKNIINLECTIKVKGESAKEYSDLIDINIQESKTNVSVRTVYPSEYTKNKNLSFNVNYIVNVPFGSMVKVENQFGGTVVSFLKADLSVDSKFGSVKVSKCSGKNDISNKFGSINVNEIGPNSEIENQNGSIKAKSILGDLRVRNSFGECRISDVKGNINLNNKNGEINLKNVSGRADVENAFGNTQIDSVGGILESSTRNCDIEIKNINSGRITNSFGVIKVENVTGKENLTITNNNGRIIVKNCSSSLYLRNSFDYIELIQIDGRVDITSNNSNISLHSVKGDIQVENSFGSVETFQTGANITIRNRNGDVTIRNIEKLGSTYNVDDEFGSIKIEFPTNISAQFQASTWFGSIDSDFPLQISKEINSVSATGKTGNGDASIHLGTKNASIYIRAIDKK